MHDWTTTAIPICRKCGANSFSDRNPKVNGLCYLMRNASAISGKAIFAVTKLEQKTSKEEVDAVKTEVRSCDEEMEKLYSCDEVSVFMIIDQ